MNTLTTLLNKTVFVAFAVSVFLITACSNPAGSEENHQEPAGAVLKMNGQEIARYDQNGVTGSIEVAAGSETTLITINFLTDEGDEFQPDEPEFSLNWKDIDTSIADIEQHTEDGKWSFHLQGITQGNTSVVFQLFHDGHSDFDTLPIPVTVN